MKVLFLCLMGVNPLQTEPSGPTQEGAPGFRIDVEVITQGYDSETKECWIHPHVGVIPKMGEQPARLVLTMQRADVRKNDHFFSIQSMVSADNGKTWSEPIEHKRSLGWWDQGNGMNLGICDYQPVWHRKTRTLLGIGHTVYYQPRLLKWARRQLSYSVFDPDKRSWGKRREWEPPDRSKYFQVSGCGQAQRVELPNGDLLIPFAFSADKSQRYRTTVGRFKFDGETLQFVENGTELSLDRSRGLFEPSLTRFRGMFYLTLRNDKAGYVTSGTDGLHFGEPKKWTFDDGQDLGNYNTQQHWVTHKDRVFLVYTRRGADNDEIFRHRAPIFIAQVDADRLQVLRETETVLIPKGNAAIGNFAIAYVSPAETWVTVAEYARNRPQSAYKKGVFKNNVILARILWAPKELTNAPTRTDCRQIRLRCAAQVAAADAVRD